MAGNGTFTLDGNGSGVNGRSNCCRCCAQARDQQRLEEQRRCAAILREQLAERERQRQWQEELQDQVSGTWAAGGGGCISGRRLKCLKEHAMPY